MNLLTIHPENRPDEAEVLRDHDTIAERLWTIGVLIERWTTDQELSPEADEPEILSAYRHCIDHLIDRYEFRSEDVISLRPDHPQKDELRAKFLNEHTHDDFEVRFFVDGRGLFYLHPDDKVYIALCEAGDLISIPAHTRHWFDMGETPRLKAIRLFTTPEGWIANFTASPIAESFPKFEAYLAQYL